MWFVPLREHFTEEERLEFQSWIGFTRQQDGKQNSPYREPNKQRVQARKSVGNCAWLHVCFVYLEMSDESRDLKLSV